MNCLRDAVPEISRRLSRRGHVPVRPMVARLGADEDATAGAAGEALHAPRASPARRGS